MRAYSMLRLDGEDLEVRVIPQRSFSLPTLSMVSCNAIVSLEMSNDQLAEIAEVIQRHLERARHHETPDQQQILNHEHEEALV